MSLDNKQQMEILKNAVKEGYRGSYTELWTAADPETQQENIEVAETPQQQEQGLEGRASQDMPDAMVFPQSQGDFNTTDMQAPIDIEKYGPQGDLVQSYKSVPPGVDNLPMGDDVGTVIERPAEYKEGGFFKNVKVNTRKKGGFYQDKGVKDNSQSLYGGSETRSDNLSNRQAKLNAEQLVLDNKMSPKEYLAMYQEKNPERLEQISGTDSLDFIPSSIRENPNSTQVMSKLQDLPLDKKKSLETEVNRLTSSVKNNLSSDSSFTDMVSFAKNLDLSKIVSTRDDADISKSQLRNMAYSLIPGYDGMAWWKRKAIDAAMSYKGLKQGGFKNVEVNTRKK